MSQLTAGCTVWCKSHHHGSHPDDTWCRRTATGDYGTLQLIPDFNERPIITAYNLTRDELTLDQAEAYARDLLALVAAARIGAAA